MAAMDSMHGAPVEPLEADLDSTRDVSRPRGRRVDPVGRKPREAKDEASVSDRRGVVKLLAAGAVGAVAGATLRGQQATAADGDAVVQGHENNATNMTTLTASNNTALYLWSDVYQGLETDGAYGNAVFTAGGDPPLGQAAWAGTLWVDKNGDWWASTHSDTQDAQWRKLAGRDTAGALHLLPAPKRVYDSRPGEAPISVGPKAPLVANTPRTIDATQNSSGVPSGSRGVLITLTVTGTGGPGFAAVWPSGAWPGTSNINFTGANQTIATTTVVGLASGATFQIQSNTTTHVIIDVIGYYL
jgi:hypothetical protein